MEGDLGQLLIVAIAGAITYIDTQVLQPQRDAKRRRLEEHRRLRQILEIMRDPKFQESMRKIAHHHRLI